jgi:hypothetical protein
MGQTIESGGDSTRLNPAHPSDGTVADAYSRMVPLCSDRLVGSFDPTRGLFSRQLFDGVERAVDDLYPHETLTSSCIALLGMARWGIDPDDHGIDADACVDAIAAEVTRTGYNGGVGLLVWANAVAGSRPAADVLQAAGTPLEGLVRDLVPRLTTMETAWLASGLLHETARDESTRRVTQAVVDELRVRRYRPGTRLMCHAGSAAPPVHRARRHIANFADQIYSVQAFAFAALVLDDREAFDAGEGLVSRHCELQGPLGQWWWHYDTRRGHVALRYGVYSVHQHGMAPMALMAMEAAGATPRPDAIRASVGWIDDNELGASMIDADRSTVWRNVDRSDGRAASALRGLLETVGVGDTRAPGPVRLNRETRPYEWAWCLYAAAIHSGRPRGRALA